MFLKLMRSRVDLGGGCREREYFILTYIFSSFLLWRIVTDYPDIFDS